MRHAYVRTLDGWRAVAIGAVLLCHGGDAVFSAGGALPSRLLYSLSRRGALGVDVFFGISGLLICGRLLEEEHQTGTISLRNFYVRRVFRILPAAFAYLAVVGALAAAGIIPVRLGGWLSCVFFFRNYMPSSGSGWYTGHFWSLAVEEHFYLICPGLLLLCGPRRARIVVPLLAIAIAVWRVLDFHSARLSALLPGPSFYERTDVRLDALFWGCWMALTLDAPASRDAFRRWLSPFVWTLLAAAYVACVAFAPPMAMMWEAILIPLLLAGTILHAGNPAGRILEHAAVRWIGRISYSLYLWQQLFLIPHELNRALGPLQVFPLNLVALMVCAVLSYYALEKPMIAYGRKLLESLDRDSFPLAATRAET